MDKLLTLPSRPKVVKMSHLTEEQRYTISSMSAQNYKQGKIANVIGKHKSVVSREIQRNCDMRSGAYSSDLAQRKYEKRQKDKHKKVHFNEEIKVYAENLLSKKYSPEQIVGQARKLGLPCVSHERIYQHIWQDKKKGGKLHKHLRTTGKPYHKRGAAKDKRGAIKDRVDISQRPELVEERGRFGDLEIDTIIGKDHKGAILTINDRATGLVKIKKLNGKDAPELAQAAIDTLISIKPHLKTITSDNGKEFAQHKDIAKALEIDFYFAKPYHSWERGSNENLNGLIRQYIPKKTDFNLISDDYIAFVENELNNRPRKRFNFESPLFMWLY